MVYNWLIVELKKTANIKLPKAVLSNCLAEFIMCCFKINYKPIINRFFKKYVFCCLITTKNLLRIAFDTIDQGPNSRLR
jgi:hypothetical protein